MCVSILCNFCSVITYKQKLDKIYSPVKIIDHNRCASCKLQVVPTHKTVL